MEQTAVELLIASIAHDERTKWMVDDYEWKAILKQARLEEKEQMIEFAKEVFICRYNGIQERLSNIANDIYNETFKQD